MGISNALNATQQGTQYQDSLGQWSGLDGGTATQVLTSNGTGVAPSFQAVPASTVFPLTVVNGSSPYVADPVADYYLSVDSSTTAFTIQLPDAPAKGKAYVIKDSAGNSETKNITITTVSGVKFIDGPTSVVLAQNYGAAQFIYNGADWEIF